VTKAGALWWSGALAIAVATMSFAAACDDDDGAEREEVTVFAASSLTDAFKEAGAAFEAKNVGMTVTFNFAASSALAVQINEGAPADVFASADEAQMDAVRENAAGDPSLLARNLPVVIVPEESTLTSFEELAEPGLRLVLGGESVPIGRYARRVFERASGPGGIAPDFAQRVLANLKSEEANVRAVLTKVQLGEADAGVVYQTDVPPAGVRAIEIPSDFNVVAEYQIVVIQRGEGESEAAKAFLDFILGPEGQAILKKHGFASGGGAE
jgi:molybdate transport system substrate-binding protein